MKALLKDTTVVDISEQGFPVHSSLRWMEAPEGCQTGWVLIDGTLQPKPEEPKTQEEIKQEYINAIKSLLNSKAQEKDYENELTISTYINSASATWQSEASQFVSWRDDVWNYAYNILDDVESGAIERPPLDDFINDAPVLDWS